MKTFFVPPMFITIHTPIMSLIREYTRGIFNRSSSGVRAQIRLSTTEDDIINEACKILLITDNSTFFRWCALRCANEIISAHDNWKNKTGMYADVDD